MSLEKFYYNLLHIHPLVLSEEEIIVQIEKCILEQMQLIHMKSNTVEGLCKVASYNIGESLKQLGMDVHYINTFELLGCFEHVAVIINYQIEKEIRYILIDTTFEQFVENNSMGLNPSLTEWPGKILKTKNPIIYENLMQKGYSRITQKDYEDYLHSFSNIPNINQNKLFDILLDNHKRK